MHTPDTDKLRYIRAEKVKLVYSHSSDDWWGSSLVILFISDILWEAIPHPRIVIWFCVDRLVEFFMFLLWLIYKKSCPVTDRAYWHENLLIVVFATHGVIQGSSAIFLFPTNSVPHQAMMSYIVGGIIAGVIGFYTVKEIPRELQVSFNVMVVSNVFTREKKVN